MQTAAWNNSLYQQIEAVCMTADRMELADKVCDIVDRCDHMTITELDEVARVGGTVMYKGGEYVIKRIGYEYSQRDCDKIPYVELLDKKTRRSAVYAKIKEISYDKT